MKRSAINIYAGPLRATLSKRGCMATLLGQTLTKLMFPMD